MLYRFLACYVHSSAAELFIPNPLLYAWRAASVAMDFRSGRRMDVVCYIYTFVLSTCYCPFTVLAAADWPEMGRDVFGGYFHSCPSIQHPL